MVKFLKMFKLFTRIIQPLLLMCSWRQFLRNGTRLKNVKQDKILCQGLHNKAKSVFYCETLKVLKPGIEILCVSGEYEAAPMMNAL